MSQLENALPLLGITQTVLNVPRKEIKTIATKFTILQYVVRWYNMWLGSLGLGTRSAKWN